MEKLLDFEKSKHMDGYKMYRFQCDCLSSEDAMDIDTEPYGDDGKFITLRLDFKHQSLWVRFKYAWQIIRGHWGWREFIPRKEDYGNLSNIFNPDKGYGELP